MNTLRLKILIFAALFSLVFAQNYCVEFDPADAVDGQMDDYIKLDDLVSNSTFNSSNLSTAFTFECFIKPQSYHLSYREDSFILWGLVDRMVIDADGHVACRVRNIEGNYTTLVSNDVLLLDEWSHIALTYYDGNITIYINGENQGSADINSSYSEISLIYQDGNNGISIGIGYMANGWWSPFDGYIEEIRLSNTLRYTSNFTVPINEFVSDDSTVFLYHMNDIVNNKIINNSSYGSQYDADIYECQLVEDSPIYQMPGNGSINDPYEVSSLNDLIWIAENNSLWNNHFIQTADIDASGTLTLNQDSLGVYRGWLPIGNEINPFTGSYDGNDHTIDNLYINRDSTRYIGLFGYTNKSVIENLGLENLDITGWQEVGSLVGYALDTTHIVNCYSRGTICGYRLVGGLIGYAGGIGDFISNCNSSCEITCLSEHAGGLIGATRFADVSNSFSTGNINGDTYVGGFIGMNYRESTIDQCYSTGTVNGITDVGGFAGLNRRSANITNSYSTGNVIGNYMVGGFVGLLDQASTISECYSDASVNGDSHNVGGFVGYSTGSSIINRCYSEGAVYGKGENIGGLVGHNINAANIYNCYSNCNVTGESPNVGGLVGRNVYSTIIDKCYSRGSVTGTSNVGGLVGENLSTVTNSFWDTQTSGLSTSSGGVGKTTNEMMAPTTFINSGWNFSSTWNMDSKINNGYPYLTWAFDAEEYWADHIIASYDFSGNANDGSGNGHHGTELGGVTLTEDRFGNANSAYTFDGVDDMIEIPNFPEQYWVSMQKSFSISVWCNVRGGLDDGQNNYIIGKGWGGPSHYAIAISLDSVVWAGLPNVAYKLNSVEKVIFNSWYHIVFNYDWDMQIAKIYLNNELVADTIFERTLLNPITNETMKIGRTSKTATSTYRYFNGNIDDVVLFNEAISTEQIDSLYRIGEWGEYPEHIITDNFDGANRIDATDIDNDGDIDIIGSAFDADDICLWENNGDETYTQKYVSSYFNGVYSFKIRDIDKDGYNDIAAVALLANTVSWFKNNGDNTFTENVISSSFMAPRSVDVSDINGDGHMDIIAACDAGDEVAWWENNGSEVFTKHVIESYYPGVSVCTGDINRDGRMDVIASSFEYGAISWYENLGNNNWTLHRFPGIGIWENEYPSSWFIYPSDQDNDGDIDILSTSYNNDDISLWVNDGTGIFERQIITDNFDGAWSVNASDIDGDGDSDIISAGSNADQINWWENNGDNTYIEHIVIRDYTKAKNAKGCDIDQDGDIDFLCAAYTADKISWFENEGTPSAAATLTDGSDFNPDPIAGGQDQVIGRFSLSSSETFSLISTDIKLNGIRSGLSDFRLWQSGDSTFNALTDIQLGNMVAFDPGDSGIVHFDNFVSPISTMGSYYFLTCDIDSSVSGAIQSIIQDNNALGFSGGIISGTVDNVSLSHGNIYLYYDTPVVSTAPVIDITSTSAKSGGNVTEWGSTVTARGVCWSTSENPTIFNSFTSDSLAGNEYISSMTDLTRNTTYYVRAYATNALGTGYGESVSFKTSSFVEHKIANNFNDARSVSAMDIDGDGDIDILGAAKDADDITWWENDGSENFTEHTIKGDYDGAIMAYAMDIDRDNDIDILGVSRFADDISWWENDGNENFTEHTLDGEFDGANSVCATDIDADGDIDIIGAAFEADAITLWRNDGNENFAEYIVSGNFDGAYSVYSTDVDGDGDMDILGAAYYAYDITWWENDGRQTFTEHTIDGDYVHPRTVYAADIDRDGDMDVLGAATFPGDVTWWENDGNENFTEHTIDGNFGGPSSVYATDVDGDGDIDVLGTADITDDITWWENDGSENFTEHTIDDDFNGATSVYAADVDGDGDIDVLGAAKDVDDITWWENDGIPTATVSFADGSTYEHNPVIGAQDQAIGRFELTSSSVFSLIEGNILLNGDRTGLSDFRFWQSSDNIFNANSDIQLGNSIAHDPGDGGLITFNNFASPISSQGTYYFLTCDIDPDAVGQIQAKIQNNNSLGFSGGFLSGTISNASMSKDIIYLYNIPVVTTTPATNITSSSAISGGDVIGDGGNPITARGVCWSTTENPTIDNEHTIDSLGMGEYTSLITGLLPLTSYHVRAYAINVVGIAYGNDTTLITLDIPKVTTTPATNITSSSAISGGDVIGDGGNPVTTRGVCWSTTENPTIDNEHTIDSLGMGEYTSLITGLLPLTSYHVRAYAINVAGISYGNNVSFTTPVEYWIENIISSEYNGANIIISEDMDSDGDTDIISAAKNLARISVWENNGNNNYYEHIIQENYPQAWSLFINDVNQDGKNDILATSLLNDDISWWENTGDHNFIKHTISNDFDGACSVFSIDLDGDGDMDVLGAGTYSNEIKWWQNDGNENFSDYTIISNYDGAFHVSSIDFDSDGDKDILTIARYASDISWFENDGNENFTKHQIKNILNANSLYTIDIDHDGDYDVLGSSTAYENIYLWENNGSQEFTEHIIIENFRRPSNIIANDIDGDGKIDVIASSSVLDNISWWKNTGNLNFDIINTISNTFDEVRSIHLDDLDSDGDLDILGTAESSHTLMCWEKDGSPTATASFTDGSEYEPASTIGEQDQVIGRFKLKSSSVFSLIEANIVLNEERIGLSDFSLWQSADSSFNPETDIQLSNTIEHDPGDNGNLHFGDFVSPISTNGTYYFLICNVSDSAAGSIKAFIKDDHSMQYSGGKLSTEIDYFPLSGNSLSLRSFNEHIISNNYPGARSLSVDDIDYDGDMDLIAASETGDELILCLNNGFNEYQEIIIDNIAGINNVMICDMDYDGDKDIIGTSITSGEILIWESFGPFTFNKIIVTTNFDGVSSICLKDIDGDSDIDIVGVAEYLGRLSWWENKQSGQFIQHIINNEYYGGSSVKCADIDSDFDLDLITSSNESGNISWWENNGVQNFTQHILTNDFNYAMDVLSIDLDMDGDMDIIGCAASDNSIRWWENDGEEEFIENIVTDDFDNIVSIDAKDIDGDSDIDIIGAGYYSNSIEYLENNGNQEFSLTPISSDFYHASKVSLADMDDDGDLDIFGSSYSGNSIAWWEHKGSIINDVNFMDGSKTDLNVNQGDDKQVIGRFQLESANISSLYEINIKLNLERSGASNICLWESQDSTFNAESDSRFGNIITGDPGEGCILTFKNFNIKIDTSTTYFFLTCDLSEDASGNIEAIISDNSYLKFSGGKIKKGIANAKLSKNGIVGLPVSVSIIPDEFGISNAYPNPFNPSITIQYGIKEESKITLIVYNILGQKVDVIMEENKLPGIYSLIWQPDQISSGMYILKLQSNDVFDLMKVIFIK